MINVFEPGLTILTKDDEEISFVTTETGIEILRDKHKDLFISYQDLVEKLEGQLILTV